MTQMEMLRLKTALSEKKLVKQSIDRQKIIYAQMKRALNVENDSNASNLWV